jgi:tetratricopeptide (TPR) repeat protein
VPAEDTAVLNRYLTAREYILSGGMCNEQGNEQQSFFEFQKALQINPRDEDAQYLLGISRLHERRVMERLATRPDDINAGQELAYIYCQNRRFDDAAALLEKLNAITGPDPAVYYTLARVYEEKGDKRKAIACYEKLLLIDPGNPEVEQRIRFLTSGPPGVRSTDTHR